MTRKNFVLLFLSCGYTLHFFNKFLLHQPVGTGGASPHQAAWQQFVSTILSPILLVLFGPIDWLQQDPDPPPPFRIILLGLYWTLLALFMHWLWTRKRA